MHFSLALLISAIMCAPWTGYGPLCTTLAVLGALALGYSMVVLQRARRQKTYVPTVEDWLWHVLLPAAAYAAVLVTALVIGRGAEVLFFVIGAATLLLLCVGIHNAWDTITYLMISAFRSNASPSEPMPTQPESGDESPPSGP